MASYRPHGRHYAATLQDTILVARCQDCQCPLKGRNVTVFTAAERNGRCDACHVGFLDARERLTDDQAAVATRRTEGE
jgi:hypothetical protein